MKKVLLLFLLTTPLALFSQNTIYIVVHGTWAIGSDWWHPGGDFYMELTSHLDQTDRIISFAWEGENNDYDRRTAADRFIEVLNSYYNLYEKIIVITHSHGGNIVNLATQNIEDHNVSGWLWNEHDDPVITTMYALGTPVHQNYYPNMNVIGNFYNLFSHGDYVQSVFGLYGQTYPEQDNLANISLTINEYQPGHVQLHCTQLAKKLAFLHQWLQRQKKKTSHSSYFEGQLKLYDNKNSEFILEDEKICEKKWLENQYIYSTMLFEEDHKKLNPKKLHLLKNNRFNDNYCVVKTYE